LDPTSGACVPAVACEIVAHDVSNPAIAVGVSVSFAMPTATANVTSAVAANSLDPIFTAGFPVGDSVLAQACDTTVVVPITLTTNCDPATQIAGTVLGNGRVAFSPTGVRVKVGSEYVETGSGTVTVGGSADLVVIDTSASGISVVIPITLAP
jgi:hypothetical protein